MEMLYPVVIVALVLVAGHSLIKSSINKRRKLAMESRRNSDYSRILTRTNGDWKMAEKLIAIEMKHNKGISREEAIVRISNRIERKTPSNRDLLVI
ncbi:MAG: hypothetical protein P8Y83_01100 [Gammaproteobacteria bacterium]|jgi:hypothetical protein